MERAASGMTRYESPLIFTIAIIHLVEHAIDFISSLRLQTIKSRLAVQNRYLKVEPKGLAATRDTRITSHRTVNAL